MNFKILRFENHAGECNELLLSLYKEYNNEFDDYETCVLLVAWHGDLIQTDLIKMSTENAKRFIKDYSEESALQYVLEFTD